MIDPKAIDPETAKQMKVLDENITTADLQKEVIDINEKYSTLLVKYNRLHDEHGVLLQQNQADLNNANSAVKVAQAKVDDLDAKFKLANAQRIKALDDRQAKIEADEAINDQIRRDLAAQQNDLDIKMTHEKEGCQDLLDQNQDILNKNKGIMDGISQAQADLDVKQQAYQRAIDDLILGQNAVKQQSTAAAEAMEQAKSLKAEAVRMKADVANAHMQAQTLLSEAQDKHNEISSLISDLNQKQVDNAKQLANIQEANAELDKNTAALQAISDKNDKDIALLKQIADSNKTNGIALRVKEIQLNQMQRDVDDRLKNVKTLEDNINLTP